jgi:hypothetical protein
MPGSGNQPDKTGKRESDSAKKRNRISIRFRTAKTPAHKISDTLGQPFAFDGKHYSVKPTDHLVPDPPAQRPRPPVWVVGARVIGRAAQPSLARAARWDGLLPAILDNAAHRSLTGPDELASLVTEVRALRTAGGLAQAPYDIVIEADSSREFIKLDPPGPAAWAAAGATWWIESWWTVKGGPAGLAELRRRISAGPPS